MGLFDSLRNAFNPEVKKTFDMLFRLYNKGLTSFCSGSKVRLGSRTIDTHINISNPSYDDMKRIYESKDSIIKLHNLILEGEKIEADKAEIVSLQQQYPHAFIFFCNQCLGGIIYNPNIEMPGHRKSKRESKNQSKQTSSTRFVRNNVLGRYYGKQYRPIPNNGGDAISNRFSSNKYVNEPKSVSELHISDIRKLLDFSKRFREKEAEIIALLIKEDIRIKFDDEVLDNARRNKYYKRFLSASSKPEEDHSFIVENLIGLDRFIEQTINSEYEEVRLKFPLGVKEFEQSRRFGESDIELKERVIESKERIEALNIAVKKYRSLKRKYPKGLPAFETYTSYDDGKNSAGLTIEEIIECEETIAKFEEFSEKHLLFKNWEREQSEFASLCRNLCPNKFGCYTYNVNFPGYGPDGSSISGNYKVWQTFYTSFYKLIPGTTILSDYSYLTERADQNRSFLSGSCNYINEIYDKVLDLIISYKDKVGEVTVIFGSNGLDSLDAIAFNLNKFEYLIDKLDEEKINYYLGEDDFPQDLIIPTRHVIIVELITTNSRLKKTVESIREKFKVSSPLISYISLRKGYDFLEIEEIISRKEQEKKVQREKEEAERKRLQAAEEQKRKEEEKKKQERQRRQQEAEQTRKLLVSKVSDWGLLKGSLRYFSLLKYYPTTCDFEASESEWEDRWTVWNFKNTPGKTSADDHEEALDTVIPSLKTTLISTFGRDLLKKFTLVCIPASSKVKTQRRYEEFSERICDETGMNNAYQYIDVLSSSEEKKFGGTGISVDNLSFDEKFFKDKYIILFDDVITKGDSMLRFKRKMEQLGATVICGMSIGKTTHSR